MFKYAGDPGDAAAQETPPGSEAQARGEEQACGRRVRQDPGPATEGGQGGAGAQEKALRLAPGEQEIRLQPVVLSADQSRVNKLAILTYSL